MNFPVVDVSCIFPDFFFVHKLIQFAGPYLAAKRFNDKTAGEWHEALLFSLRNLLSSPPPPLSMGGVASRETFEQILRKLSSEDVDPGDHQFWDEMWKTTLAVEVSDSVPSFSLHSL